MSDKQVNTKLDKDVEQLKNWRYKDNKLLNQKLTIY